MCVPGNCPSITHHLRMSFHSGDPHDRFCALDWRQTPGQLDGCPLNRTPNTCHLPTCDPRRKILET